jgi:hypothetical protein
LGRSRKGAESPLAKPAGDCEPVYRRRSSRTKTGGGRQTMQEERVDCTKEGLRPQDKAAEEVRVGEREEVRRAERIEETSSWWA